MADEPDMRDMLKKAMTTVFGMAPSFRLQLGRGVVRPVAVAPAATALEPISVPDTPAPAGAPSELERLLIDGLGAMIVSEVSSNPVVDAADCEEPEVAVVPEQKLDFGLAAPDDDDDDEDD